MSLGMKWDEWRFSGTSKASQTGLVEQAHEVKWDEWRFNCSETRKAGETGLAKQVKQAFWSSRLQVLFSRTIFFRYVLLV